MHFLTGNFVCTPSSAMISIENPTIYRLIYTVRLCRMQQAYDTLTTGLRHDLGPTLDLHNNRKRVVDLIYKKQFMW